MTGAGPLPLAVRAVGRELAAAQADKIAQVVAMVDALPSRGAADSLIAALRPRLAQLHLPRPLGLARLLFTPLDPVLVAAPGWRRGSPAVPRTVLAPLAAVVRAGLGPEAAALDARLGGRSVSDATVVLAEGRTLWPRAATALRASACPAGWASQTGLAATDHAPVCRAVALALSEAADLAHAATCAEPFAPDSARIGRWVGVSGGDDAALATLLAIALTRLPQAETVLDRFEADAAEADRPALRRARELAAAFVLGRLEAAPGLGGSVIQAADEAHRSAVLLDAMTERAQSHPGQRARVQQVRRTLDESCRSRFQAALEADLVVPSALDQDEADEAVSALERAARALHRFEQAARRIGGAEFYDRAVRDAAARVGGGQGALSRMDRARLTELLLGPDAAMAVLAEARQA